jgi:hypothetical protein
MAQNKYGISHKGTRFTLMALLIGLGVAFAAISTSNTNTNFEAMYSQREAMVNMVADDLDEDIRLWGDYDDTKDAYLQSLISDIEFIDSRPHTIGILYDADIRQLSDRVDESGVPENKQYIFDPTTRKTFLRAVEEEMAGSGSWEGESEYGRIKLYWRWIPTGGEEYLMVAGISMNAVAHASRALILVYNLILAFCVCIPVIDMLREQRAAAGIEHQRK